MALPGRILAAFEWQAAHCARLGSPFTGHLCARLPEVLGPETAFGRRVAEWPLDPVESALALRLCGALHRAVREGLVPGLAALYPPTADTGPALDAALAGALEVVPVDWLDSAPQTNEVARSGVLIGGLLQVAAETGLPIELMEIGSSAGLNLHADCYRYDLGNGLGWGRDDSGVNIACPWSGGLPPLDAPLRVVSRAGSDIAPLDPGDARTRERMLSYIWPDQPERLARAAAAMAHAAAHAAPIARADAAEWVAARLAEMPRPGVARVLMHSVMWQYLPEATQAGITRAMEAAGAAAAATTPLGWLRLESDGESRSAALWLTLWPGGMTRMIGRGCWHGRFAEWGEA